MGDDPKKKKMYCMRASSSSRRENCFREGCELVTTGDEQPCGHADPDLAATVVEEEGRI